LSASWLSSAETVADHPAKTRPVRTTDRDFVKEEGVLMV
jgi:hypothetical protein